MEDTLGKIELSGIETGIDESKATSGGYLAIFELRTGEYRSRIQMEVSLRKEKKMGGTAA